MSAACNLPPTGRRASAPKLLTDPALASMSSLARLCPLAPSEVDLQLLRADVPTIDDFARRAMDVVDTAEVYEIIVERHRRVSTILTSNRDPGEMLAQMADPPLAQSAIGRLRSNAHELVIDGECYRRRQRPGIDTTNEPSSPRRH